MDSYRRGRLDDEDRRRGFLGNLLVGMLPEAMMARPFKYLTIVLLASALVVVSVGNGMTQSAPSLGVAESFSVLGGSAVTNTGTTVVNGDLGVFPGSAVTGFPPGIVVPPGALHTADAVAQQAQSDIMSAYDALAGQACHANLTGLDLGGLTLTSGVYCFDTSAQLTGALALDVEGNPNAVFIFKIASTLTTAPGSSIVFVNGGPSCNVFWQVGSSATLNTSTQFAGNIIALTSITLNTNASVAGRAIARNGAVTLDSNNITRCTAVGAATDTPLSPTQTAIAATQTAIAPTLTAGAMTPTPTLAAATQTAIAATQTVIAATAVAVAPTLTALAMTPNPTNLDESDQPPRPIRLYLQWVSH